MPIKHLKPTATRRLRRPSGLTRLRPLLGNLIALGAAAALLGFFILTLTLAWLSRGLPDPNTLLERNLAQSTKIYDRTGEMLLYEIHGDEKRTLVKVEDIPDVMKWATIAIEDKDFYKHHGVYWRGLVRAFTVGVLRNQRVQGTSTLTQQFVKNALLSSERSLTRKLKELLLSIQIERKYTKDQILQLYLNEIPYGSTLYGVESAAQGYFGKPVNDLSLDEAALLAALPQAPDTYNPYGAGSRGDNRDLLIERQHTVLNAMAAQGYISQEDADAAKQVDTLEKLIPKRIGNISAPHFVMWVREQLVEKYGQRMVETGGLKVVTTLDWDMQQAAEKAVAEGVEKNGERYQFTNAALAAVDPKDGNVLAMAGSHDFFDEEHDGQVNVTLRPRQPGSSFKPIVYAAGFIRGYLPETTLWDVNTVFRTDTRNYAPKNYDLGERGPVSVRSAIQLSLNIPAVKMLYLVGVGRVLDLAEQMGYTTFDDRPRFGLSLVLGGGEVRLLDHVAAYGVFAAEGIKMPTVSILKVEAPDGETLEEWKPTDGERVFEPQIARLVSGVLSDDAARAPVFGAGSNLTLPGRPVAAKTGTTNDYHDAWTMGYTPSLAAGVWAGNNNNDAMNRAGGSLAAAPIWNAFMREAVKNMPVESFTAPAPPDTDKPVLIGKAFEATLRIDTVTGKLATDLTPPELVEERTFHDAHSILYYVDKDNPRGETPKDPSRDPQFANWEQSIKDWVEKKEWNTTSTPPTETDDVHTSENTPGVRIASPSSNEDLYSRNISIHASASAPRRIVSFTAKIGGYVIGHDSGPGGDIQAIVPNALERGSHELIVEARDDVGNVGSATVRINLLADPLPLQVSVTDPGPGSRVYRSDFPYTVTVLINDLTDIVKVDLYAVRPNGTTELVGSEIQPDGSPITFRWSAAASLGDYTLYAVTTDGSGSQTTGDRVSVGVE